MPTPDFILSLRAKVGSDLLWLSGVTGVVRDQDGRVLLGRRADTHDWALPSGILEPGEQPAEGLAREVMEETCVEVSVDSMLSVWAQQPMSYPNGDRSQYLDLAFSCTWVAGEPAVGDGELTEVGWFALDALPDGIRPNSTRLLDLAARAGAGAFFDAPTTASRPLAELDLGGQRVVLRRATEADLAAVVGLLADDQLGAEREDVADLQPYAVALQAISNDPSQLLVVAEAHGEVVGTLQVTIIPGLSHRGATRGQLEAVRVASALRGAGLGSAMVAWAVQECRRRGCRTVQLTSNAVRADAHRFYERLGFTASHTGFKLGL